MRLDRVVRGFSGAVQRPVSEAKTRLATAAGKLDALSPLHVLSRGYALVSRDDVAILSAGEVKPADNLSLRLHDGTLDCRVVAVTSIKE